MKTYEKPRLAVISLSGNDQLCGSCAGGTTLYNNPELQFSLDWLAGNQDGTLTREELEMMFGPVDSCVRQIESYCKFTSQPNQLIAWS